MDDETTRRIARALEGALAVFRDGKGRLTAADIHVQSVVSAVRSALLQRISSDSSPAALRVIWDSTSRDRAP